MLPADKRGDVERLYAWCRWCDDGVDHSSSLEEAAGFVDRAKADLHLVRAGEVPHATESLWFGGVFRRYELPVQAAEAFLEGVRSDLVPAGGWDEPTLLRYCFRVAGAVGVMMCPILGTRDRKLLPHAAALGMGMQLTNIARDVGEDWERGRCYLPVEWTDGLRSEQKVPDAEKVRRGVGQTLRRADAFYQAGELGIAALPRSSRLAVRSAARVYHAIGSRIRSSNFRVLERRAYVPLADKLRIVAGSWMSGLATQHRDPMDPTAEQALEIATLLLHEHGVVL